MYVLMRSYFILFISKIYHWFHFHFSISPFHHRCFAHLKDVILSLIQLKHTYFHTSIKRYRLLLCFNCSVCLLSFLVLYIFFFLWFGSLIYGIVLRGNLVFCYSLSFLLRMLPPSWGVMGLPLHNPNPRSWPDPLIVVFVSGPVV